MWQRPKSWIKRKMQRRGYNENRWKRKRMGKQLSISRSQDRGKWVNCSRNQKKTGKNVKKWQLSGRGNVQSPKWEPLKALYCSWQRMAVKHGPLKCRCQKKKITTFEIKCYRITLRMPWTKKTKSTTLLLRIKRHEKLEAKIEGRKRGLDW